MTAPENETYRPCVSGVMHDGQGGEIMMEQFQSPQTDNGFSKHTGGHVNLFLG